MNKKKSVLEIHIIQIYILLSPFISAFALNPWLPLPLMFMLAVATYILISFQLKIFKEDIDIIIVIILGILAFIFNIDYLGWKNINHTAAVFSSVAFFYIIPKILIIRLRSIQVLGITFAISLGFVSIFVLLEFVASNYLGIRFLDFIPYTRTDLTDALVAGTFIRPRGFAEEAGHMALFYELALPLSFLYLKDKSFIRQILYYIPVLASFILLFSAAAFITLPIAIIIVALLKPSSKNSLLILLGIIILIMIFISSDITRTYIDATVGTRFATFIGLADQTNFSALDRINRYQLAFNIFLTAPLGIGWGMSSQLAVDNQIFADTVIDQAGLISLYAEILVASGFPGLVLFLIFIGKRIYGLIRLNTFESQAVLVSALSISLHYIFMSNYWFPMLWFPFILADNIIHKNIYCKK